MPTEKPETPRQARNWETVKRRYLDAGLCLKCSSQAAYGHQHGFAAIRPPCEVCERKQIPACGSNNSQGLRAQRWLNLEYVQIPAGYEHADPR